MQRFLCAIGLHVGKWHTETVNAYPTMDGQRTGESYPVVKDVRVCEACGRTQIRDL